MNNLYKIYRIEFGKRILLCSTSFEDIKQFKTICKNSAYVIFYNDKDVTKKYK